MSAAVVALTENGMTLARNLSRLMDVHLFFPEDKRKEGEHAIEGSLREFTGKLFDNYSEIIYIMACGIVVRSIAPYIRDKRLDPAVVVMDEKGRYSISVLSGHMGGANRLAAKIAGLAGAQAVITTSTDVNNTVAFDVFARENDCIIENFSVVKSISSLLVNGGKIGMISDFRITGELPENIEIFPEDMEKLDESTIKPHDMEIPSNMDMLANMDMPHVTGEHDGYVVMSCRQDIRGNSSIDRAIKDGKSVLVLRPRVLVSGIGLRKGKSSEGIEKAFLMHLENSGLCMDCVKGMATVDIKAEEPGLMEFCRKFKYPLKVISREEIAKIQHKFRGSEFVEKNIGVTGVCEPCAVLGGNNTRLISGKGAYDGVTVAFAMEIRDYRLKNDIK